jgi:SAM-dependent methyltransferase
MIDTDRHWEKWGRDDPYFGVLSEDRFSVANIEASREEFFRSGRGFVRDLLSRFEESFGPLDRQRVLDHGCGVGRLSLPFARHFERVVALDVSQSMIAEAKNNAARDGAANIDFLVADDQLSRAEGQFDFVNSHLTLQHIPVRRGVPILFRLIDKVRPGGGFHVNFSVRTDSAAWRLLYWASANVPGVKLWQNICAGRPWNAPAMQMNNYPLKDILEGLTRRGIHEFDTVTEEHSRFRTISLIGRKPAQP